jgi:hypothetical protein
MLAINDLNVSLDLDQAALAAVSGAGTHYTSWSYSMSGTSTSAWKLKQNSLISQNAYYGGVRHNLYKIQFTRTHKRTETATRYKYVG